MDRYARNLKQVLEVAIDLAGVKSPADLSLYNLLLGIARVSESEAAKALTAISVDLDSLKSEVESISKMSPPHCAGRFVLERAEKEATQLGDTLVSSEHLLLALTEETLGEFGLLMAKHGINWAAVHRAVSESKKARPPVFASSAPSAVAVAEPPPAAPVAVPAAVPPAIPVNPARPPAPVPAPAMSGGTGSGVPVHAVGGSGPVGVPGAAPGAVPGGGASGAPGAMLSKLAAEPVGAYPHARRVGNLLFLSGIGPRKRGSKVIPGVTVDPTGRVVSHDIETQVRSCFENVRMILEEFGSSWGNIVDVTVFLTDMKNDFATFNRLWADYFRSNPPTRTTVGITSLPTPIAFEVKVIAVVGEAGVRSQQP